MNYYLAKSTNPEVRKRASSGGFTREYLAGLLKYSLVDQVLQVRAGIPPQIALTDSQSEILREENSSSVYYPINPLPVLKQATGRVAATLLACHISKASPLACTIELLCKLAPQKRWTLEMLQRLGVDPKDVQKFAYRHGEFPGLFTVWTLDGQKKSIDWKTHWPDENREYFPRACKTCKTPHTSEIVCGDAWHLENSAGYTLVKISDRWNEVAKQLEQDGRLELIPVSEKDWESNNARFYRCKESR